MIQVLDERTLIEAYRIKLSILTRLNNTELNAESLNYLSQTRNIRFNIAQKGTVAKSPRYIRSWANLQQETNRVVLGLASARGELDNTFNGYKNSIKNFSSLKKELEKQNYLNRKRLKSQEGFFERYQNFSQESLAKVNTLKHPEIIDYYFNKDSLCNTLDGLISLPTVNRRVVKLKEVCIETRFTTPGSTKEAVENIKTNFSSHQYVCKPETALSGGAELTYCLEFSKPAKFDKITILDASVHFASVSRLFVINDASIDEIDFTVDEMNHKKVLYINDPEVVEAKKIYITFNQLKYIDISQERGSSTNQIISAAPNPFEPSDDESTGFIYEFNIDSIVVEQSTYQNIGMFKLDEKIDVKDYSICSINWNGHFLNRFNSIKAFIEGEFTVGNTVGTQVDRINDYSKVAISKYDSIRLILILETDGVYSGYIKSIDVKAV